MRAEITDLRRRYGTIKAAFDKQARGIADRSEADQRHHKALLYLYGEKIIYDPWFMDITADLGAIQLRTALAKAHTDAGRTSMSLCATQHVAEWWFYIFMYIVRLNRSVVTLAEDLWNATLAKAGSIVEGITHHSITARA